MVHVYALGFSFKKATTSWKLFFDIMNYQACLYSLTKFRQNLSKIGHLKVFSSKVHRWIFSKRTILNYPMHGLTRIRYILAVKKC